MLGSMHSWRLLGRGTHSLVKELGFGEEPYLHVALGQSASLDLDIALGIPRACCNGTCAPPCVPSLPSLHCPIAFLSTRDCQQNLSMPLLFEPCSMQWFVTPIVVYTCVLFWLGRKARNKLAHALNGNTVSWWDLWADLPAQNRPSKATFKRHAALLRCDGRLVKRIDDADSPSKALQLLCGRCQALWAWLGRGNTHLPSQCLLPKPTPPQKLHQRTANSRGQTPSHGISAASSVQVSKTTPIYPD